MTTPEKLPLLQARQAKLLEACGFPCEPAGDHNFAGKFVPMWRPTGAHGPAKAEIMGYGGAAYGGKTYGMLLLVKVAAHLLPGVQITFFRRTYTELDGPGSAMAYARELFTGDAKPSDGGKKWEWPNGSCLFFRHCQNENDVYNYQSQQFDILILDEGTHFSWTIVDYLITRNRGTIALPGFHPFAVIPSNPGNIGHTWYSDLFDVTEKQGPHEQLKVVKNQNGKYCQTYFVPAFLEDNQIGVAVDPGYEARLMQRDVEVAKALRYGDWMVFAGQAFPNWLQDRVACQPFEIPEHWPRWRAIDYGYDHPWTCGWFTMNPLNERIYVYRAILKSGLTDQEQAAMVNIMTPPAEHISFTFASPDMWARKTAGMRVFSSVDEYKDQKIELTQADNDRQNGKRKVTNLLADLDDGKPGIQVFEEFYPIFRCMTTMIRDERGIEDVKKVDGDDAYDMLRYGLTNKKELPKKQPGQEQQINRSRWAGQNYM